MTDPEERLRHFRPASPPPELRARVIESVRSPQPSTLRDWLPALATAALIALLYVVATGIRARAYTQIVDFGDIHEIEVPAP
jgi:hypothetical protein